MSADVAKIAAGLTKAQRGAVLRLNGIHWRANNEWLPPELAEESGIMTSFGWQPQWCLTPLGLAVRAILMEQSK